jgi:alpha-tubulin suppressor-like RCC1 family protein
MSKAKVYFWGASLRKEERGINILEPQLVKGVTNPIQVAIGGNFIVILSEDGKVSTFGEGSGGRFFHSTVLTFVG